MLNDPKDFSSRIYSSVKASLNFSLHTTVEEEDDTEEAEAESDTKEATPRSDEAEIAKVYSNTNGSSSSS